MDDVAAAWERWLGSMHWAYWATGSFTRPLGPEAALRVVSQWLAPLGPRAYAAVGIQHGPWAAKLHVHVLVGGVRRVPLTATLLRGSWLKSGHVQIDGYHPAKGAVEYLVRQADDIELLGDPRLFDPRCRRPRKCDRSPGTCLSAPTTGCPAPPRIRDPPRTLGPGSLGQAPGVSTAGADIACPRVELRVVAPRAVESTGGVGQNEDGISTADLELKRPWRLRLSRDRDARAFNRVLPNRRVFLKEDTAGQIRDQSAIVILACPYPCAVEW